MNQCHDCHKTTCPFASSEESEIAQGYGCLPSMFDIVGMALIYNKAWICHSSKTKICKGALPYVNVDMEKISLDDNWEEFIKFSSIEREHIRKNIDYSLLIDLEGEK